MKERKIEVKNWNVTTLWCKDVWVRMKINSRC